jgi:predicted MFS family arabinose efflux permease
MGPRYDAHGGLSTALAPGNPIPSSVVIEIAGDRSYRALLRVPTLGRVLVSMQIARTAQSMLSIALVLFTLATYGSPGLAGIVTFASIFPGLVVSPIAGALLDRHGRVRLVVLDYVVALVALVLIGTLALGGLLPAWLLVAIALVSSITGIFSHTGLRSLFPILVPRPLWERVNAVDSNGYVVATIIGPPLAAGLVATLGGPTTILAIAVAFGVAAMVMIRVPEPHTETETTGRLLVDAWQGLRYFWRNPTLRGLGFSLSIVNLAAGMTTIVIPLVVVDVLGAGPAVVGLVFAVSGVAGMVSALFFGRVDTRGREWPMIVIPMFLSAGAVALILPAAGAGGVEVGLAAGLVFLAAHSVAIGLLQGPLDIALFTVRQRRTDPAWMGRAFAVSMAVNFLGFPVGAAVAGAIASVSLPAAVAMGVVACLVGSTLAALMIPRR